MDCHTSSEACQTWMRRVTHQTRHVTHQCVVSRINAGILRPVLKGDLKKRAKTGGKKIRTNSGWLRMARGGSGAKAFFGCIRLDTAAKESGLPARAAKRFIKSFMMLNHRFFWVCRHTASAPWWFVWRIFLPKPTIIFGKGPDVDEKSGNLSLHCLPYAGRKTFFNATWFWKDFQNATSFQNEGTFSSNVGVIQVFSREGFNSVGQEKPKEFSKIPRFLGGFKWGLYFSWFFFEKSCSNLVNQYFSQWEKYWWTKDWSAGFMTPFHSTSKADFCVLKSHCVVKISWKPRRVKKSPATGVRAVPKRISKQKQK